MNRKLVALMAGAALLISPVVTQVALAQTANSGNPSAAWQGKGPGKMQKFAQELNLSEQQIAQLKQIHQETRSQMDAVLTAEQKAKLREAMAQRKGMRGGMKQALNLTEAQKAQIKAIQQAAREKRQQVFTPEQQALLKKKMEEHRGQRRVGKGRPQGGYMQPAAGL